MLNQLYAILINGFIFGSASALVAFLISPLQFLKVIRQQTGFSYSDIFFKTLKSDGWPAFFRGALPYGAMNFLSSMAFGISEYIAGDLLGAASLSLLAAVFLRSTMGGATETLFSLYSEMQEISRNKGSLIKSKPKISSILLPILIRNTIFWYGSVVTYELSVRFALDIFVSTIFAFVFGVLLTFVSIPLDVIATQNCGAQKKDGMIKRLKKLLDSKNNSVFAGAMMRIIQTSIFTIVTVATMLLV